MLDDAATPPPERRDAEGPPTHGLRPSLVMEADESTTSYVSRLANLHGKTALRFCADLGLGFQALVDGGTEALTRLAHLSGAPLALLRRNAVVRTGPREHVFRGQAIGSENLSRYTLRVCPVCVRADMRRKRDGLGAGPYGRAIWLVGPVKTCPIHRVSLQPLPSSWETAHDFAATLRPELGHLLTEGVTSEQQRPSALEEYLTDRLEGRHRPDAGWLDELGFSAVVDTCETLGAVAAFGRSVNLRPLTPRERRVAGDIGYSIMEAGPDGIREALAAWDAGMADRRPDAPATRKYGPFADFLYERHAGRPDLEPIRAIVLDHVMWNSPVGPGDIIIGRRIDQRYVHSVRTAADAYGLDTRLVRKLMRQVGALGPDSDARSNRMALFDARANADLLEAATRLVRHDDVRFHIDASEEQTRAILWSGMIPTFMPGDGPLNQWARLYAPDDLDRFLDRLTGGAEEVSETSQEMAGIVRAACLAKCHPVLIVRLVLDRRLRWVGRMAGRRGYNAVRVHVAEVADRVKTVAHHDLLIPGRNRRLPRTRVRLG